MKKEETYKRNTALKNECDLRSRSLSPKAYLGCGTCRSKTVKSNVKLGDCNNVNDRNNRKKSCTFYKREEEEQKEQKIKLTDLCDEDKGRIVKLIEELSKLEEKNAELNINLQEVQRERKDQQEHMLKQASLFLEEKNYFINEINKYKSAIEIFEEKICHWENSVRVKDNKIIYFVKALQKSLKEKNELQQLMNRLKNCLKDSLQSFQKLKDQVTDLQSQEQERRTCISVSCQTENHISLLQKKSSYSDGEIDGEYLPANNQIAPNDKNSLDVITDKLEYVCQCLKKKREKPLTSPRQKFDIDLSILLKNDNLEKEDRVDEVLQKNEDDTEIFKGGNNKIEVVLKPQRKCSKTLLEVENILKHIGHPLNVIVNECTQAQENHNLGDYITKEPLKDFLRCSDFLQNKIVQQNNIFKISEEAHYGEDQILEELFYSDQSINLGLEPNLKLETNFYSDRPFTW